MTAIRRPAWWFRLRNARRWWSDTTEARGDFVNSALFLALVAAIGYRLLVIGAAA